MHVFRKVNLMRMEILQDCIKRLQMKQGIVAKLILIKFINYVNRLQIYQRGSDRYINEFRMECILL